MAEGWPRKCEREDSRVRATKFLGRTSRHVDTKRRFGVATRRRFCSPRLVAANQPLTSQRLKERATALQTFLIPGEKSGLCRRPDGVVGERIKAYGHKFGDARLFHGDAVHDLRDLHGAFAVRDQDELRVAADLLDHARKTD